MCVHVHSHVYIILRKLYIICYFLSLSKIRIVFNDNTWTDTPLLLKYPCKLQVSFKDDDPVCSAVCSHR